MRLKDLLETGRLAPLQRARAGNTLATLGDPRFNPEHWFLPADENLGFIRIPAGRFIMGSNDAYDSEKPQHELDLPYDYWLAKYPVTVAQYRFFVEQSGYQTRDIDSLNGTATHPMVSITWYDALAYCDWLSEQLFVMSYQMSVKDNPFWQGFVSGKLKVSLPSEAEWEKAVRGVDGRVYPWGEKADPNRANYDATGIGDTSPVGAFPGGASPSGLLDLSGNTWEWTRSLWGKSYNSPEYKYPYQLGKQYEDLNASNDVLRVLRGAAFFNPSDFTRCAYRYWLDPYFGSSVNGFRLVVLSPKLLS